MKRLGKIFFINELFRQTFCLIEDGLLIARPHDYGSKEYADVNVSEKAIYILGKERLDKLQDYVNEYSQCEDVTFWYRAANINSYRKYDSIWQTRRILLEPLLKAYIKESETYVPFWTFNRIFLNEHCIITDKREVVVLRRFFRYNDILRYFQPHFEACHAILARKLIENEDFLNEKVNDFTVFKTVTSREIEPQLFNN